MKIYILDQESKEIQRLLSWLSQDRRVSGVEVFSQPDAMISRIAEVPAEFCVIRLGLVGIQGLQVAEEVKQIHSDTKIVFISNDRDYALDAYELGAYGYLISPVSKEKFDRCITKN